MTACEVTVCASLMADLLRHMPYFRNELPYLTRKLTDANVEKYCKCPQGLAHSAASRSSTTCNATQRGQQLYRKCIHLRFHNKQEHGTSQCCTTGRNTNTNSYMHTLEVLTLSIHSLISICGYGRLHGVLRVSKHLWQPSTCRVQEIYGNTHVGLKYDKRNKGLELDCPIKFIQVPSQSIWPIVCNCTSQLDAL